jgi:uncharacterized protein
MIPGRLSGLFSVSTRVGWTRRWYEDLGWRSARQDDIFVSYPIGRMTFALWSLGSAAPNVAAVVAEEGDFSGTLLCTVVDSPNDLDAALDTVAQAGGRVVVPGHDVAFGRSGWFLDPAGTTWEVAFIAGCSSAVPFAGAPLPDALPVGLSGAIVAVEDPLALADFYSEGLGWSDARRGHGDHQMFDLEGGTLMIVAPSGVPAASSGPIPLLQVEPGNTTEHSAERLVHEGAVVVRDLEQSSSGVWVADPFGVHWFLSAGG